MAAIDDARRGYLQRNRFISAARAVWPYSPNQAGERSIPSNIAEGKRRKRQRVYLNHLDIALGSQAEVEVQLEIAKRVGFLSQQDHDRIQAIVAEVGRMLNGLITAVQPRGGDE